MGIEVFDMVLTKPQTHIYHPGDIVSGSIKFRATPDVNMNGGITIIMYGLGFVEWPVSNETGTNYYTGRDELFKKYIIQHVTSKQIEYPFCMQIPEIPLLPWTSTTDRGRIQYGVNAIIKRPWYKLGDKKVKIQFKLESEVNMRLVPFSRNRSYYGNTVVEKLEEFSAGCCCFPLCCWCNCSDEKIKISLKIESLWNNPGDDLSFSLDVDNSLGKRNVGSARMQLIGIWIHKGNNSIDSDDCQEIFEKTIYLEDFHEMLIKPGEKQASKGILKIPETLIPTQVECDVFKLTYKLKAVIEDLRGFQCAGRPGNVEVDVVIGSV